MRGCRLTGRGKIVLIIFVILFFLSGTKATKGTAVEKAEGEYSSNEYTNFIIPVAYTLKLQLNQAVTVYNDVTVKLNESVTETQETVNEEFLSVSAEDIRTDGDGKLAFLTFDDGPSKNVTPRVLDILDEYQIKATFFVLGSMCDKNDSVLKDIYSRKHSIGNHSYSHVYKIVYKDEASFINEVKMTDSALKRILGDDFSTRLFRFPGGSFEAYKKKFINPLNKAGYISVDWNAVTGDSEVSKPTPDMLMKRLKATVKNKNNVIILMHDIDSKQVTADILPDVIEYLKSEGYEFAVIK